MNQLVRQSTSLQTLEGQQTLAMKLRREMEDMPEMGALVNAAAVLIGSDPTMRPHDPEMYVETMVAHLSKYPRFVLEGIVDPRNGVMTLKPYPPKIADVEEFAMPIWNASHRQLRSADEAIKQLEPPDQDVSEEDKSYISEGLKALSKQLAGNLEMRNPKRKPRANQCASGDAIRKQMGLTREPTEDPAKTATTKT